MPQTLPDMPAWIDRHAPARFTIAFTGLDLRGAGFVGAVRLHYEAPGAALAALAGVTGVGVQGIRLVRVERDPVSNLWVSTVEVALDEATVEAFPAAGDPSQAMGLVYDIHCAPAGGVDEVFARGPLWVRPGVER